MIDPWFLRELRALAIEGDGTEGLERTYRSVDTCAAEFEAATPYFYSAHERPAPTAPAAGEVDRGERAVGGHPRLGSQPDRPGDRVRLLLRARGDDRARPRPRRGDDQLQSGDGLDRLRHLRPPLLRAAHRGGRARGLRDRAARGRHRPVRRPDAAAAREVAGGGRRRRCSARPVDAIDLAEDRGRFGALLRRLEIKHPPYGTALSAEEAVAIAEDVGFPLLVRPSYVLGGRAMEICYTAEALADLPGGQRQGRPGAPAAARPLPRERDRGRRRRPGRRGAIASSRG